MAAEFLGHELEEWYPMEPQKGPPLPIFLGIYWPWYEILGAEFRVSDLVISPREVQVGNPVTISCTVENIGTESGDYIIELGGDFVAQQSVTLAPGETRTISFEVVPDVAKTYSVSVDGLYGSFTATEKPVADIRVEDLTIEPPEVMVGEVVSISVRATNYGGKTGSKTVTCLVS